MNNKKIAALDSWGADTKTAINRMLGDEVFYLNLVDVFISSTDWSDLSRLISEGRYKEAFIISHRMKGSCADLSLGPLFNALCELTDDMRNEIRPTLAEDEKTVYELKESLCKSLKMENQQ